MAPAYSSDEVADIDLDKRLWLPDAGKRWADRGGKRVMSTTREPAGAGQRCFSSERIACPPASSGRAIWSSTWASMPPAPRRARRSGRTLLCQQRPTVLGRAPHATWKFEVTAVMSK